MREHGRIDDLSEAPSTAPGSQPLRWGLFAALVLALLNLGYYFTFAGLDRAELATAWIAAMLLGSLLSLSACIVMAVYKRSRASSFNLGSAMASGVATALVAALAFGLFRYAFYHWGVPGVIESHMAGIAADLREQGIVGSDAERNMYWNRQAIYGWASIVAIIFIFSFLGLVVSVISGLLLWRR